MRCEEGVSKFKINLLIDNMSGRVFFMYLPDYCT